MKKLIYLIVLFLVGSCNQSDFADGLLLQKPESSVASSNFWNTESDLAGSSRELHARLRNCFGDVCRRVYRDRGLLFDYVGNLWRNISNNELEKSWHLRSANISWELEYNIISEANQILGHLDQADIPEERKNFYRGESLTIRAWTYFYILRTWGNAPLVTGAFENGIKAKTSWQDIAGFIIKDLKEAVTLLPPAGELKDSDGRLVTSKQIPSRGTAYAILAHVCAWKGSLNNEPELLREGIKAASEVINSGDYSLVASPSEVCSTVLKGNSVEGIFELSFYDLEDEFNRLGNCMAYTCEAYPVIPNTNEGTKRRNMRLSEAKAKEVFNTCGTWFDEIIYHYEEMAKLPDVTTQGAVYIWKFRDFLKHEGGSSAGLARALDQNEILIRLADIILLRAEMRARTGDRAGAIEDLNIIRERCEAPLYAANEGDLLDVIFHQREQELFLEGISIRFFDIVRNGMDFIHKKLGGRFKEAQSLEEIFFPYSSNAFDFNPLLIQNEYWQNYIPFRI